MITPLAHFIAGLFDKGWMFPLTSPEAGSQYVTALLLHRFMRRHEMLTCTLGITVSQPGM